MKNEAKKIRFRSVRAGALGLSALLLASPVAATTRVTVNADICNWTTAGNPGNVQYYNSGVHNLATDITTSVDVWCAIPFTIPVNGAGNLTTAPVPIEMRYAGFDGDSVGGIKPTCSTRVNDSNQQMVFTFGDAQSDVGYGPWVISIVDNGPAVLETYTFAARCTIPVQSDLYNMSLGPKI